MGVKWNIPLHIPCSGDADVRGDRETPGVRGDMDKAGDIPNITGDISDDKPDMVGGEMVGSMPGNKAGDILNTTVTHLTWVVT